MPLMHAAHMAAPTPVAAPAHEPPHNDVIAQRHSSDSEDGAQACGDSPAPTAQLLVGGGFLLRDGGSSFAELLLQDIVPDEA